MLSSAGRLGLLAARQLPSSVWIVRGAAAGSSELTQQLKDKYYPKLGNCDIVGYGWNGNPTYMDRVEFPCPPVRFRENDASVKALREKEKGDWKKLSMEDKKALYRASFRQTFSEFQAPTGEWKAILGMVLMAMSFTGMMLALVKTYVLPPLPHTITEEWQRKQVEYMVKQRQGAVEGVASHWDYENNRWK